MRQILLLNKIEILYLGTQCSIDGNHRVNSKVNDSLIWNVKF